MQYNLSEMVLLGPTSEIGEENQDAKMPKIAFIRLL